jgi:DNA-binding CsgD family transcriptional regulator
MYGRCRLTDGSSEPRGPAMKPLSVNDLPKSEAIKLVELGYEAGGCDTPRQFENLLNGLTKVFPVDAAVAGYGTIEEGTGIGKIWSCPKLPSLNIARVFSMNWPSGFLKTYLEEDILSRDSQFYLCLLTQRPQLWIDLYEKNRHRFNPATKRGFDPKYVEIAFDYELRLSFRFTHIDSNQHVGNFNLLFHNRKDAYEYSQLLQATIPYLHDALLHSDGKESDQIPANLSRILSSREREVLKWLSEGKSNWEIGQILSLSHRTVKLHVHNLMRKFGAMNRYQLVANAFTGRFHTTQ